MLNKLKTTQLKIAIQILRLYKRFLSPFLEFLFGKACRFTPTCSEYTIEALEKYGFVRGLSMGFKRVFKCNPLSRGGYDPVTQ